jgi:hypothetical protein
MSEELEIEKDQVFQMSKYKMQTEALRKKISGYEDQIAQHKETVNDN